MKWTGPGEISRCEFIRLCHDEKHANGVGQLVFFCTEKQGLQGALQASELVNLRIMMARLAAQPFNIPVVQVCAPIHQSALRKRSVTFMKI